MKACSLLLFSAFMACCSFAEAQSAVLKKDNPDARPAQCATVQKFRVLDERSTGNKRQALAVDADERVLLLNMSDTGHVTDFEPLGYEQPLSSEFPFRASLPPQQALLTLRRVSCAERGWKIWVALTVGFQDVPRRRAPLLASHVYVFRQPPVAADNPVLLNETFREVSDLIVDDINGDQQTEIAVLYTDADANPWMKLWQIDDSGQVSNISLDDIKHDVDSDAHVEIGLGDYRHGGELLFTEQRVPTPKGWRVTRRYYDWDSGKHRYELAEVVQTDEITLK